MVAMVLLPLIGGALYAFAAQAILVLLPSIFQEARIYSFYASPVAWALMAAAAAGRLLLHGFYLALPLSALSCFLLRRVSRRHTSATS